MKSACLGLVLCLTTAALAGDASFPAGKYEGKGTWRGPQGSEGSYDVQTEFTNRTLKSSFVWSEPGKAPRTEKVVLTFGPEGKEAAVAVLDDTGKSIGEGFCFEGECFYRAEFGAIVVAETFRWENGRLHKLGTKSGPGFRVVWTEELTAR
jgi:hypothetical protein